MRAWVSLVPWLSLALKGKPSFMRAPLVLRGKPGNEAKCGLGVQGVHGHSNIFVLKPWGTILGQGVSE